MPSDLEKLQGTWQIISLEVDGREFPPNALGESRITIKGSSFTSTAINAIYKGTVQLEPDTRPKKLAAPGKPRPTDFSSKPGSGHSLTIWRLLRK